MDRRTRGNVLGTVGILLVVAVRTVLSVGERLLFGVGIVYALVGVVVVATGTEYRPTTTRAVLVALFGVLTPVGVRVSALAEMRPELRVFGPAFNRIVFVDPAVLVWLVVALSVVYATLPSPGLRSGLIAMALLPFVYVVTNHGDQGFGYVFDATYYGIAFVLAVVASVPVYLAPNGWRRTGVKTGGDCEKQTTGWR